MGKSFFDITANIASKDANNAASQANSFVDSFNAHSGENVSGKHKKAISDATPQLEEGLTSNPGLMNPNILTPESASNDPLYQAKANSESYKVETPGKANGGLKGADSNATEVPGKKDVYFSNFNNWSLMNYVGGPFETKNATDYNTPIYAGETLTDYRNPTASRIIELINDKNLPAYKYSFADFALAKYYGKVPNTHMITLRRFPFAVEDNIVNPNVLGPNGEIIEKGVPDIARAVTWMTQNDNKLEDILKFSVSTEWKKVESQLQEIKGNSATGGKLGSAIGGSGLMSSIYGAANGMNASQTYAAKNGFDSTKGTYPNHVFGPINIIKEVMIRDKGLGFEQSFELKFHYSLRQLKGVSPKIAFLDMMSNILVLTYNNGNFWGGASRYVGGSKFQKPFGDMSKLKSGDFGGFLGSIMGDAMKGVTNIVNDIKSNGLAGSKLGNNLIGGSLMKLFGTPQAGEAINALLTGDATGQYHITIGNPLYPVATIGNLICEGADFQFSGEMSYEGFPTELTVTVKLKPGRPRDKADIERMFNGGRERMYLTPVGGVNTNLSANTSAYGNADNAQQADIYRKMTNG